jgi:extracellular elastinolytic metalloproteinase
VIPIKKQSVPDGFETLRDPSDRIASPRGWHSTPYGDSTTTSYAALPFPLSSNHDPYDV